MGEVMLSGSIESAIVAYLEVEYLARSETAHVTEEAGIPASVTERYVNVKRTGGPRLGKVQDSAQIEVSCYAETSSEAEALAYLTRGLIWNLEGQVTSGLTVYRVQETGGPVHLPNPRSRSPRYRFIEQVDYRMASE